MTNTPAAPSTRLLELSLGENDYHFATSIADARSQTELELGELHESLESLAQKRSQCDTLDYTLAAASGALCGLMDLFLVGSPGSSPLGAQTDRWIGEVTCAFAQRCHPDHKAFDSLESAIRFLENRFKIPYDQTGLGDAGREVFNLNAKNHHFKSLAHNPSLLGLFFSILDQFANTAHFVSGRQLIVLHHADESWQLRGGNTASKLFCGFVNWFGHLVSDVSGSQSSAGNNRRGMGLPSPLWTWINDLAVLRSALKLPHSELLTNLEQLAREIFEKGFDLRFQAAQAIPVLVNELLTRFLYAARRLFGYFSQTPAEQRCVALMLRHCEPFSTPTVKRMLTVAHGVFCLIDIGDATVRGFVSGGTFNPCEFFLRLNIAGVGRLTISLYGETKRLFVNRSARAEADEARRRKPLLEDYIQGLQMLSAYYDDQPLARFIADLLASDAYQEALAQSVALAEARGVSSAALLKNKADIDRYFGG